MLAYTGASLCECVFPRRYNIVLTGLNGLRRTINGQPFSSVFRNDTVRDQHAPRSSLHGRVSDNTYGLSLLLRFSARSHTRTRAHTRSVARTHECIHTRSHARIHARTNAYTYTSRIGKRNTPSDRTLPSLPYMKL